MDQHFDMKKIDELMNLLWRSIDLKKHPSLDITGAESHRDKLYYLSRLATVAKLEPENWTSSKDIVNKAISEARELL